jgi:hypothetical protein
MKGTTCRPSHWLALIGTAAIVVVLTLLNCFPLTGTNPDPGPLSAARPSATHQAPLVDTGVAHPATPPASEQRVSQPPLAPAPAGEQHVSQTPLAPAPANLGQRAPAACGPGNQGAGCANRSAAAVRRVEAPSGTPVPTRPARDSRCSGTAQSGTVGCRPAPSRAASDDHRHGDPAHSSSAPGRPARSDCAPENAWPFSPRGAPAGCAGGNAS